MIKTKKRSDIVRVYQSPLSREKYEGEAELIKRVPCNRDCEDMDNWRVCFTSDGFTTERLINTQDLKYDVPFGHH